MSKKSILVSIKCTDLMPFHHILHEIRFSKKISLQWIRRQTYKLNFYVCLFFREERGSKPVVFSITDILNFYFLRTLNDSFPSLANDLRSQIYGFLFLIKQPSRPLVTYTKLIISWQIDSCYNKDDN